MKSNRGSVLLLTLCLIIGLAMAAYAVYDLSLGAYRLSQRNEYRARAKAVADSELEYVFFQIEELMMNGLPASQVPAQLSGICATVLPTNEINKTTILSTPTPTTIPFAQAFQNAPEGWTVRRWVTYEPYSGIQEGSVVYNYFTVRVEVTSGPNCPLNIDLYFGRNMNNSVTSIFQYNIFSQGDLEFSPYGNTVINGDIAANGNVALGAQAQAGQTSTLTMNAAVYWIPPTPGAQINTSQITDGGITIDLNAPQWSVSEAAQVQTLPAPLNLLGGLNAVDIATEYGTGTAATNLFGAITADKNTDLTDYNIQLATATNNVYRSIIAPPPSAVAPTVGQDGNGNSYLSEYPNVTGALGTIADDPGVGALRAYNRAGLIITINADHTFSVFAPAVPGSTQGTTIAPSLFVGSTNQPVITQTTMFDLREQKSVAIADVDVGALTQAITANASSFPNGTFNGVMYVYLAGSNATTPAAIRLDNATSTPNYQNAASTDPAVATGFTVATNGGLYVVGNFNTTTSNGQLLLNSDGTPNTNAGTVNPSALMADQITILSSGWTAATDAAVNAQHDPIDTASLRVAPAGSTTTIAAGLLTGNTTEQNGFSVYSGGGDNLVRFLEDWDYGGTDGATANFYGSFGRLFNSTVFTSQWYSPSGSTDMAYVYNHPAQRLYSFNTALKSKPPPCSPNITAYSRGTVFTW